MAITPVIEKAWTTFEAYIAEVPEEYRHSFVDNFLHITRRWMLRDGANMVHMLYNFTRVVNEYREVQEEAQERACAVLRLRDLQEDNGE